MNRSDLQRLARVRAREANALLQLRHYSGAFYLSGYSIECALKACVAKQTQRYDFPDKGRVVDSYTHNLTELLRLAELRPDMTADSRVNSTLGANWATVRRWTEASRYEVKTQTEAQDMIRSVSGRGGVLPWIVQRW